MPILFQELNEELMLAALERLKSGLSLEQDGIPANVYQKVVQVFVPWLHKAMCFFF